ncbi:alpha/beta hydrolase [Paenibacillus sp. MWE-103]|uniref:Alpha/beta hydrolase n=1 Tax=Paenibacillus artemisiicola TaxID=1172618 RepID=A0ABS3W4N0_9BACL|nr:alpha/beta hydrolase [Paenibacillus artemisiicola]MBO7743271.1 alpha/beta hydrolase [Paenibacillus artemisiicola]
MPIPVHCRTLNVEGVDVFYREAGHPGRPAIVLLHGFPSSSHMFRGLIPLLADRYRVIAPDYPGFGNSAMPPAETFGYTFERLSLVVERFLEALGIPRYILYVHDYGGPVGFRIAVRRPERILGFVVQNAVANIEGLGEPFDVFKALWADPSPANIAAFARLLTFPFTKRQYLEGVCQPAIVGPDGYSMDQFFLNRPGSAAIQLALGYDYRTNVARYPEWQRYMRVYQPPMIIAWGRNDFNFTLEGAYAYKRELPRAELHLLCGGHFLLEEASVTVAALIKRFFGRAYGF